MTNREGKLPEGWEVINGGTEQTVPKVSLPESVEQPATIDLGWIARNYEFLLDEVSRIERLTPNSEAGERIGTRVVMHVDSILSAVFRGTNISDEQWRAATKAHRQK